MTKRIRFFFLIFTCRLCCQKVQNDFRVKVSEKIHISLLPRHLAMIFSGVFTSTYAYFFDIDNSAIVFRSIALYCIIINVTEYTD